MQLDDGHILVLPEYDAIRYDTVLHQRILQCQNMVQEEERKVIGIEGE